MISLIIPPKDQISRVAKMLADEFGTASNIKSRVNRSVCTLSTQKGSWVDMTCGDEKGCFFFFGGGGEICCFCFVLVINLLVYNYKQDIAGSVSFFVLCKQGLLSSRLSVLSAITSVQQRLKLYSKGLFLRLLCEAPANKALNRNKNCLRKQD